MRAAAFLKDSTICPLLYLLASRFRMPWALPTA